MYPIAYPFTTQEYQQESKERKSQRGRVWVNNFSKDCPDLASWPLHSAQKKTMKLSANYVESNHLSTRAQKGRRWV